MKNKNKMTRKTKDEKRRLAFEKRNVKKEQNRARYGAEGGSALAMAKATDFNRRFIAAFLALVFAISCMLVGVNFATKADDPSAAPINPLMPYGEKGKKNDASGMVLNKYLTPNENGYYDLTLEAYATAEVKPITEKIPTDFVVVVDQSGSMDTRDMPTGNPTVQNNKYLEDVANGNYYFKVGDNYYRVYGVRDYMMEYHAGNTLWTQDIVNASDKGLSWFQSEEEGNFDVENQYYFKDNSGIYRPITVTIAGKALRYEVKFRYVDANNNIIYFHYPDRPAYKPWVTVGRTIKDPYTYGQFGYLTANAAVKDVFSSNDTAYTYATVLGWLTTGMYIDKPMYTRHLGYNKLCYRDVDGVEHEVPSNANGGQTTWEYCDSNGYARSGEDSNSARPTYSGLYTYQTTTDRLTALKAALNEFAQAVANETDDFGAVDNRISIVGFSSTDSSTTHDPDYRTNRNYNNTELLTHIDRDIDSSSTNGWQKAECDNNVSEYYGKGLVGATDGTIGTVNSKITNAIRAITANGGTQPEDGLNMAYQVLTNRGTGEGKDKYVIRSGAKIGQSVNRNTIVIFFTDGQPGNYHESDQYAEANEVVAQAKYIKDYGASLFSIGVFGESDGNPLTYADTSQQQSERNDWKYLGGWMETYLDGSYYYCLRREWRPSNDDYTATPNDTIFDYMSVVSSNYPDAKNYIAPAWLTGNFNGNYIAATDGDAVRQKSTAELTNKYYRMASNQATLVAAFLQAVTMNNEQSDLEPVPASSIELKDTISDSFSVKLDAEDNPTIKYYTQQGEMGADGLGDFTNYPRVEVTNPGEGFDNDTKTLTVKGFDFSGEHISSIKTGVNAGRKLIVVIEDVIPKDGVTSRAGTLYSNQDGAGINIIGDDGSVSSIGEFPRPYISRHSYKLEVTGDDKSTATFKVAPSLINGSDDTSNVILVYPNESGGLTRIKYTDYLNVSDEYKYFDMKDGQSFYFENVPADYSVETSIIAKDTRNTYTWTDLNPEVDLSMGNPTSNSANPNTYSDNVLHITSVANVRTVTIKEAVDDSAFANQGDKFVPEVYIEAPTGVNVDETATFGETEWVKDGENRMVLKDPLIPIKADEQQSITLTLPSGWKLFVDQTDDKDYSVKSATYKVDTTEATSDYAEGGWNWSITKDATITITNTRPSIPVEGINNSSNHNWIIYILVGIAAIAVIAGGIFLWKKRNEFVEE